MPAGLQALPQDRIDLKPFNLVGLEALLQLFSPATPAATAVEPAPLAISLTRLLLLFLSVTITAAAAAAAFVKTLS